MSRPLLDLEQEWHRQRAQLRANHQRPPPLVTAGLDLAYDEAARRHHRVQVSGMALIFGIFPPTVREFVELARTGLRLGRSPARQELQGVLNTRVQSLWAWLPTLAQDCYLELDHATDEVRLWLIGPQAGQVEEVDAEADRERLDEAFLAASVMTGPRHWGGQEGLARLVERFGRLPLLVAAQVAEALERDPRHPEQALGLAQARWPRLDQWDETAWAPLADQEPPWACVQLGRLALRLGLWRAARLLLNHVATAEAGPAGWFDLGQACEALDDLPHAEQAFARFAAQHGDDADGWRRLLIVRLRLGLFWEATEALKRYRAADGIDGDLIERALIVLRRPRVPLLQRAHLAGWLCAKAPAAAATRLPVGGLLAEIGRGLGAAPEGHQAAEHLFGELIDRLRAELAEVLVPADDDARVGSGLVEAVIRVSLLALPFLGSPASRLPSQCAAHALLACKTWGDVMLGAGHVPDSLAVRACLLDLARLAIRSAPAQPA